jgi:hypothetical protein
MLLLEKKFWEKSIMPTFLKTFLNICSGGGNHKLIFLLLGPSAMSLGSVPNVWKEHSALISVA